MKINFRSRLALIFALVAMAFSNATADETFQSILGPMRGNGDTNVNMTVPATTQLLFANAGMTFIWDGTMGIALYNDNGSSGTISGFDYNTMKDGFGYSISGTLNGLYEDYDMSITVGTGLTLGSKTSVTPIVATGSQVAASDRSMLYTYVQMEGTYTASNRQFVADDGTEFAINSASPRGIPTQDGHGTIKAFMYGGAGNGQLVRGNAKMQLVTLEDNAFVYDDDPGQGDNPQPTTKTFADIFAESINDVDYTITMPENAQMLYEFLQTGGSTDYECILWDGTAALRLYVGQGLQTIFPERTSGTRNFGKKVTGTVTGKFESYFTDYSVNNAANLQLGDVAPVTPKVLNGMDCIRADKVNLHAYVQLSGIFNHESQTFTADDGQQFIVNASFSTVPLPQQSGHCTMKALFAGNTYGSVMPSATNPSLFLLEEDAVEFGGEAPIEVRQLSLADLKNEPAGLVNFKFETDKVRTLAVAKAATATADDRVYFWDGTDGLMVYGKLGDNQILNAAKGQLANGEIFGQYYPNYGGMLKIDSDNESHKVDLTLGETAEVAPLMLTLADLMNKSDNTYSYAYVKVHGTISGNKFVDGSKEVDLETTIYNADLAENDGKSGYIYAIRNPEGGLIIFEEDYFEADAAIENKYNSFEDLLKNAADAEVINYQFTAGTQILDNEGKHLWLWDGTSGLYIYSDNGYQTTSTSLEEHMNGNLVTGNVKGKFDATFFDVEAETIDLQIGSKQALKAKKVSGNDAIKEDRTNLFAYVELTGTYDAQTSVFTTDDNVPFAVVKSATSNIEFPTNSGHGTLKAMVYGNGTGELFEGDKGVLRIIEPNAFAIDNNESGSLSIAELMKSVENGQETTFRMPANTVLLLASLYTTYYWDGTAGMLVYADNQTGSYLYNWDLNEGNYTGFKVVGEFTAKFNSAAYSFDNPTASTLTVNDMVGVTPKKVSGSEACREDRSNLFAYIEMTGTYDVATKVFIADDGTAFNIYGSSTIGLPYDDGHGTLKAMMYGDRGRGGIRQDDMSMPYLMTLESDAFTLDASAIENVNAAEEGVTVYDLQGRRIDNSTKQMPKGIYIVNGKKVILK